ncbi:MAG: hypothetical protein ACRC38_06095, partial [Plesiomonas sp.]
MEYQKDKANDPLRIADRLFTSRLLTGSGKFASATVMQQALAASGSELVTMALKRVDLQQPDEPILRALHTLP